MWLHSGALAYLHVSFLNPLISISTRRDPTDEYFRRRHNHDLLAANLGPYHAGLEPYHDLDLPELRSEECEAPRGEEGIDDKWVPYTAIIIMFIVLIYSSVTSWTSSPAKVNFLLTRSDFLCDSP